MSCEVELLKARLLIAQHDLEILQKKYDRLQIFESILPKDCSIVIEDGIDKACTITVKSGDTVLHKFLDTVIYRYVFTGDTFNLGHNMVCQICHAPFYSHDFPILCPRCKK